MYRLGHTGIALLVLAPLSYGLLEAHRPFLPLIISLGVLGIEPLPDYDFKIPFLDHRGVSHSLFAAVSVGDLLSLCGGGAEVLTRNAVGRI
jgi:inner membrane protein